MPSITLTPLFIPGGIELGILLLIVILLFGARKIPELARSSGEAIGEFKKGREELEEEIEEAQENSAGPVEGGVAGNEPN